MKTALIVDADLGFGFWLGRGLDQAHYHAFPAKAVADAAALVGELRIEVDLLVLDPALPDAAELIESLRRSNERLKVVALIGDQPQLPVLGARVDLCCRKPERSDIRRREWIAHVEELLPVSLFGAAFDNAALLRKCAGALVRQAQQMDVRPFEFALAQAGTRPWKEWQGRVVDRFPLERHLGGGDHTGVFLTSLGNAASQIAAIKLIPAEGTYRDSTLSRWERAAALSHPGLLRCYGIGHAELDGTPIVYRVMEYAEENLAEVLRQRPLTAVEAREMLEPILDALAYIHSRGFVHGRVKPSNILAVADQLKISTDALRPAGEPVAAAKRGAYDPPESTAGLLTPAADVWSLGITLVEALTQRPPAPRRSPQKPPQLPVALPPLFLDIARQCLQPDPNRRETVAHLADRLRHGDDASASPAPGRSSLVWRYAGAGVALGLIFSGILVYPPHRTAARVPAPPPVAVQPPPAAPVATAPAPVAVPPPAAPLSRQVKEQVLPEISQESRETIRGRIDISVRASVDASGAVVDAKLDSAGPSRYFANRALAAAEKWKFDPRPDADPEEWVLRFAYTKSGTQVSSERAKP
ncbi:MAG TPA: protein kinase [Bryobacteraceae bacterium]|jgi:hypothetical protein